jgi:hypothetical protein
MYRRGYGRFQSNASTNVLDLSFVPVEILSRELHLYETSYPGDEELKSLRNQHPDWSFWRSGETLYLWPTGDTALAGTIQASPKRLVPADNPPLVSAMILQAFEQEMVSMGFTLTGRKRRCFVNLSKGNFLVNITGTPDGRVGVYPKIVLDSFFTSFAKDEYIFGLVVDVDTQVRLGIPVSELIRQGMDCRGLYVVFKDPEHTRPDLAEFDGALAGKIVVVNGADITLDDARDPRLRRVDASLFCLEPTMPNLRLYIDAVHPSQAAVIKQKLDADLLRFHGPKRKWELIDAVKARFMEHGQPRTLSLRASGLAVRLGRAYQPREDSRAFRFSLLRGPRYSHDYASSKTSTWHDGGLKEHGPYDQETFRVKRPSVLVVSPVEHKGEIERFIRQFEKGINNDPKNVFNGFPAKYRLDSVSFEECYFTPSSGSICQDYKRACLDALAGGTHYDLCFLVIRQDFEQLPAMQNPYYVGKSLLLSQGIPVQEVQIETLRDPRRDQRYVLNNIGLACYAKMGGTPYVLRADEVIRRELVIGIGRAFDRDSRLSPGRPVIGFTTVFKNNGDFMLSGCTPYCDFDIYEKQLENVIVSSVEKVAEREGYQDGEEVRIIFHVFKKTGQRENRAVLNALASLERFRIEYALVHVNDSHLFSIFDRTNTNNTGTDYVAPRGICIELGPRERLVNLIGPQQYLGRGCPTPLRLTLDRCSTFKDINYLCQQVYEFSFMSWRGFNPGIAPATLLYSEWIARMNSNLRKVPNWNQNMLSTLLADKRWFL